MMATQRSNPEGYPTLELTDDQKKEVIECVENEIRNGRMEELEEKGQKTEIITDKLYDTLQEFLEESGVIYRIESDGVYVWKYLNEEYGKLVGYAYDKRKARYIICIL